MIKHKYMKGVVAYSGFGVLKFDENGYLVEPELTEEQKETLAKFKNYERVKKKGKKATKSKVTVTDSKGGKVAEIEEGEETKVAAKKVTKRKSATKKKEETKDDE